MKCPQCGIHYDDGERECPMCGARKPVFRKDASQLAKPTGTLAQPISGKKTKPHKPVSRETPEQTPQAAPLPGAGKTEPQQSQNNPVRTVKKIVILVVVLLLVNAAPYLVNTIQNTAGDSLERLAPETAISEEVSFPFSGAWQAQDDKFWLILYPEDTSSYQVQVGDYTETGTYFAYENTADDSDFPEQFPAEDYSWWTVSLSPDEIGNEQQLDAAQSVKDEYWQSGSYLSIFQDKNDPNAVYFEAEFDDIPWMTDGNVYQVADEDALRAAVGLPEKDAE